MESQVRVRFAPSPTGFFHIGSARTALFNWLYARHTGGSFVLRIEDTDRARNTDEALRVLLEGMRWLGLDWDEGPEKAGPYGPYFQSQRDKVYQHYLEKLRAADRVYEKEGALWFRLEGERYTVFDEFKGLEVEKVKSPTRVINDRVRGRVEKELDQDFVIVRSNGEPVFHFTNVVDDIAMKITHVIRGEDHLSNTPRHVALFEAFGEPLPEYAHIPLILKQNGPGKMSKRDQGALIEHYQAQGYLPEAVANFLSLLGWNPKDGREVMGLDAIAHDFDFPGIQRSNARFDEKKMQYINQEHLRALPLERFVELARPKLAEAGLIDDSTDPDYLRAVMALCQEKIRNLPELPPYAVYCFTEDYPVSEQARAKVFKKGDPLQRLRELLAAFLEVDPWTPETLEARLKALSEATGARVGDYIHPGRLAVSGTGEGPSFYHLFAVLGRERVRQRIERFLAQEESSAPA